jgi:hypothetical protein
VKKLVLEYLFEKFTEDDSDPIHDLNIGGVRLTDFYNETVVKGAEKWFNYLKSFYGKKITATLKTGTSCTFVLNRIMRQQNTHDFWDLTFIDENDKRYKIDMSKKIFIEK